MILGNNTIAKTISKCQSKELPSPVKACTEVSPKIPVLVKKVEYHINAYVRTNKIRLTPKDRCVALKITIV